MFVEIDNINFQSKNSIERHSNENNEYLKGWKVWDPVTNLPRDVGIDYFLFNDEIDIFYNNGKRVQGHPKLSEDPIHI